MKVEPLHTGNSREALFLISVWLKGLNGLLEIIAAVALFTVSPTSILRLVQQFLPEEMTDDPRDRVAHALISAASKLSGPTDHFIAIYLAIHGVVKLVLVWGLLRRILFTYPLSIAVFVAFIVYQLYRFTITHSLGLLVLTALDVIVIVLIYLEYRALQQRPQSFRHLAAR
jgi:uncharacterized membrane protein